MDIELRRTKIYKTSIDGAIYIDNAFVCHTEENVMTSLPPGEYSIVRHHCKQYGRFMPIIETLSNSPLKGENLIARCERCISSPFKGERGGHNTRMPHVCPMLKPGNGVHKREDGSIILGTRIVSGCLSHPQTAFDNFYNRIRKKLERGRKVVLRIKNRELKS